MLPGVIVMRDIGLLRRMAIRSFAPCARSASRVRGVAGDRRNSICTRRGS